MSHLRHLQLRTPLENLKVFAFIFHLRDWKASFSQIKICGAKFGFIRMSNIWEDVCWSIVLTCFYTAPIPFEKLYDRSMWGEKQVATEPHNAELSILQIWGSALQYFSGSMQFFRDPFKHRPTLEFLINANCPIFHKLTLFKVSCNRACPGPPDILMGQNMLMVATKMAISLAKIYFWCRRKDIIHQSKNGHQISKQKLRKYWGATIVCFLFQL